VNSKQDTRRRVFGFSVCLALGMALVFQAVAAAQSPTPQVDVATINGVIDTFTDGYIERVINVAHDDGAAALVIQLDTPGGELDATRKIVERFFDSPVPIIVYVTPSGARAGSAGVFITYAAHLAAMAPGTNIGAAHPVGDSGQNIPGDLGTKVTNDAAALMRSIATQRGRNATWGEDAVRNSVSVTEQEALKNGSIDIIARDLGDLLNQADGRTVKLQAQTATLKTRGATIRQVDMNFFEQFFHILLDPNIALILLNVGTIALIVEVYHPGAVIPGVVGVICLTLAAVSLYGLPTNWAAVILIVAGIVMMVLDIKVTGVALTVGGIIAFVLGAFFLFRPLTPPEPTAPDVSASPIIIGGLALLTAAFFVFVLGAAIRSRNVPVITGIGPLIGAVGIAKTLLNPQGTVLVKSEEWTAVAEGAPIESGEQVRVVSAEGLTLHVKKAG
jgi:membrane-bound serine protease (ClpP class)